MNQGSGGCSEPRSYHCTPAWAARAKLCLKKTKGRKKEEKKRESEREGGRKGGRKERKKERLVEMC